MKPLTTVPAPQWLGLPRSSNAAVRLGYAYYFTGEKCRNGHIAPGKVEKGCIVCMGLARARADIRLSETIALRELKKLGPVRRPVTLSTTEASVLTDIAERGGVFTQTELIQPGVRGLGKASVSRAIASLMLKQLIVFDGRIYRVTPVGHGTASRIGAKPAPFSPRHVRPL